MDLGFVPGRVVLVDQVDLGNNSLSLAAQPGFLANTALGAFDSHHGLVGFGPALGHSCAHQSGAPLLFAHLFGLDLVSAASARDAVRPPDRRGGVGLRLPLDSLAHSHLPNLRPFPIHPASLWPSTLSAQLGTLFSPP